MTASRALSMSVGLETLHSNVMLCNDNMPPAACFHLTDVSLPSKNYVVCKNSFRSEALNTQTEVFRPRCRHHHRLVK